MNFFDDDSEDFAQAAKRFGKGKNPTVFFNQKFTDENGNEIPLDNLTITDKNGNEIPLNKRVDFEDGSFIEEIREGNGDIRRVALNIKPHNHKPPKVKDPNDEPMDFFNF